MADEITIVHLSDLHFSEKNFWKDDYEVLHGPHRNGHDPALLFALDKKLKSLKWDKLVITGDLSRVGHEDSFSYLHNWIYGTIHAPDGAEIGLNLDPSSDKCVVVPGNHDRFNGGAVQDCLENYQEFFPVFNGSTTKSTEIKGVPVNFHLYDSTYEDGGFSQGYVRARDFIRCETNDDTLDIVVIHHHVAQAPRQKRNKQLELINVDELLKFLLAENINAVLFGHTHYGMFEKISADVLKKQITFKRKFSRWFRRALPLAWFSSRLDSKDSSTSFSFKREKCASGRFPSFDKYFEYRYLTDYLKIDGVKGPSKFKEPSQFYDHIKSFRSGYEDEISNLRKKKVAFSMAPSPTYCGVYKNGFHILKFKKKNSKFLYNCDYYRWDGHDFELH